MSFLPSIQLNSHFPSQYGLKRTPSPPKAARFQSNPQLTPPPTLTKRSRAQLKMYDIYRSETNVKKKKLKNPHMAYINKIKNIQKAPRFLNLITSRQSMEEMKLKQYNIGDSYAEPLSAAIKRLPRLKTLDLRNNQLQPQSITTILSNVNIPSITSLDISSNTPGKRGLQTLLRIIQSKQCSLQQIVLDKTNLTSSHLELLSKGIQHNHILKSISVAQNQLGSETGQFFAFILRNTLLQKLNLAWNSINGLGATEIFNAVGQNNYLLDLNYSWNSLGKDKIYCSFNAISDALRTNIQLRHLNLSSNYFSQAEISIISNGLSGNHTLIGLHIEGNLGKLDSIGNLKANEALPSKQLLLLRMQNKRKITHCWKCDGWTDFNIEWEPDFMVWKQDLEKPSEDYPEPVYIHLQIDDWKPTLLTQTFQGHYQAIRAVPPRKNRFFFTYRGEVQLSKNFQVQKLQQPVKKSLWFYQEVTREIFTQEVNFHCFTFEKITAEPRISFPQYRPPDAPVLDRTWSIQSSIFRHYLLPQVIFNQSLINDCFQFDWNKGKFTKLIKSPADLGQIKQILRTKYSGMQEINRLLGYKYLASIGSKNLFMANLLVLTEFLQKNKIIDKFLKIADLDLLVKATTFSFSNKANAGVSRYEFLELLVRIALDKFKRNKIVKSDIQAVNLLFSDELQTYFQIFDPWGWRWERFFNQSVQTVLIKHADFLRKIYGKYSGKYAKPSQTRYMSIEEWMDFCEQSQLLNEGVNVRIILMCFHLSLILQVDQTSSRRHMEAGYYQFLQALARVVDVTNANDPEKQLYSEFDSEPLSSKMEEVVRNLKLIHNK